MTPAGVQQGGREALGLGPDEIPEFLRPNELVASLAARGEVPLGQRSGEIMVALPRGRGVSQDLAKNGPTSRAVMNLRRVPDRR